MENALARILSSRLPESRAQLLNSSLIPLPFDDLALDVRFAGRELYGGRPRAVASWSREAGGTVLVKTVGRTVARVSAEEHMANYQAARALLGKGKKAKPKK